MATDRNITSESYIYRNGELINTDQLSKSEMEKASMNIKLQFLNCLFKKRVEFRLKKITKR